MIENRQVRLSKLGLLMATLLVTVHLQDQFLEQEASKMTLPSNFDLYESQLSLANNGTSSSNHGTVEPVS